MPLSSLPPPSQNSRWGLMFVLSSPSGAGKTSLATHLLAQDPGLSLSVSCTTRKPRPGEQDGKSYIFVTEEHFRKCIQEGAFLEHARVFNHHYGTPKKPVYDWLEQGQDVLFDVDWQGAQKLSMCVPQHIVRVFILPPTLKELANRLCKRAQDTPQTIHYRMSCAQKEISHWEQYDYVLVNKDFETTGRALMTILSAERLKRKRQRDLSAFTKALLEDPSTKKDVSWP